MKKNLKLLISLAMVTLTFSIHCVAMEGRPLALMPHEEFPNRRPVANEAYLGDRFQQGGIPLDSTYNIPRQNNGQNINNNAQNEYDERTDQVLQGLRQQRARTRLQAELAGEQANLQRQHNNLSQQNNVAPGIFNERVEKTAESVGLFGALGGALSGIWNSLPSWRAETKDDEPQTKKPGWDEIDEGIDGLQEVGAIPSDKEYWGSDYQKNKAEEMNTKFKNLKESGWEIDEGIDALQEVGAIPSDEEYLVQMPRL